MSNKLAATLGLDVGDTVELTPVRGSRRTREVPLVSTVDGFIGLECYADIRYLSRVLGEPPALNSIQLSVNPVKVASLHRTVKELPNAQGFSARADAKAAVEETFVQSMSASFGLTIIFAGVIAFGSILNASLAEIADRQRDIATFRVLGYRPGQIAAIFFRQNMILFTAGLVLAMPLGYWIVLGLVRVYDTELFRMPVVVEWPTVLGTVLIACSFVFIAQWFVYRQIVKLDWLEAVNAKE
jgi:putative ABC transport system permease protein